MWLVFSLASALCNATKNVWTRALVGTIEQRTLVLANFFTTGVIGLCYIAVAGVPEVRPDFYWSITVASLLDAVAVTMLIRSISSGDLSDAYPLVALTPVFLIGTSFAIVGELPSPLGIVGIIVIVIGSYLMRVEGTQTSALEPFKLLFRHPGARYMILTAFLFSLLGPLFKTAMGSSSAALSLTVSQWLSFLWLSILHGFRGTLTQTVQQLRSRFWLLMAIGIINFLQAIFMFLAFRLAFVAYAASVKRLEILFTVLFSYLAFKERRALRGAAVGAVLFVGVVLIALG